MNCVLFFFGWENSGAFDNSIYWVDQFIGLLGFYVLSTA